MSEPSPSTGSTPVEAGPSVSPTQPVPPTPDVGTPPTIAPETAASPAVVDTSEDVEAAKASRRTLGIRAIVITAVISALASAIINPQMFGSLWRGITGAGATASGSPSASVPASPPPALVIKTNKRQSITLRAPVSWAVATTRHNPLQADPRTLMETPGDAVAVGTNPFNGQSAAVTQLYVAASRSDLGRLGVKKVADREALLMQQLEKADWTLDGCTLTSVGVFPGSTLHGPMQEWAGCNGLADSTMWTAWTVTSDERAAVYLQFVARDGDVDRATAQQVLSSIVVDVGRLSG